MKKKIQIIIFLLMTVLIISCSHQYYINREDFLGYLYAGDYKSSFAVLEKSNLAKSETNKVLYLMEKCLILNLMSDYNQSNNALLEAEKITDELYTKSLTREGASLLTSDNILEYQGEDFERAFLNYYAIINYLKMNMMEDALVECRKLNHKLEVLNSRYEHKNIYKEDAFIYYITGLIYESQGELNDALIDYENAFRIYTDDYSKNYNMEPPEPLLNDLVRISMQLGYKEKALKYGGLIKEINGDVSKTFLKSNNIHDKNSGSLVVIHECGFSPRKEESSITVPIPQKDYLLSVAFPVYKEVISTATGSIVTAGNLKKQTCVAEDLTGIAIKNLEDRKVRTMAKTVARATAKYLASQKIRKQTGRIGGIISDIAGVATEKADLRSWLTLPDKIRFTRLELPPGEYDVEISFLNDKGSVINHVVMNKVKIESSGIQFLFARTFD